MPETALDLDLLHFEIGNRGEQLRIPIHQPLVFVDQLVAIKLHEDLEHGLRQPLVHGEAFARPIARRAQALELIDDDAAGFGFPFPDAFEEFLAPHVAAAGKLALHQLPLDHHLGRDAGVVGARLPQHVASAHALEAAENVLQRIVERMTHMQRARHIGRRDHDTIRVRLGAVGPSGAEGLRRSPRLVKCGLRLRRADRSCRSLSFRLSPVAAPKSPAPSALSTSGPMRRARIRPLNRRCPPRRLLP